MTHSGLLRGVTITAAVMLAVAAFLTAGCGKSADALYTEGKALVANPETADKGLETLGKFTERFQTDPRTPEVLLSISTANQSARRFPEAEKGYLKLIEKYPATPESYKAKFLLGYLYYDDMKDLEKAKKVLSDFVAAYPDSGLAASAKVLIENAGLPVEEWSTVKNLASEPEKKTKK